MPDTNGGMYSRKSILAALVVSVLYLGFSQFLIGFKTDQLVLVGIFNALYFFKPATRKFILGFSIFIVYWIIFDYMKAWPNYRFATVHIQDLYDAEKAIFGISTGGQRLTPNEYLLQHSSSFIDVLGGFFYLCWIPVPLAFAGLLFYKNREQFVHFALSFVLVNFVGFIGYYTYPAAPPWYIQLHGNEFIAATKGNTAGLARFDAYFNTSIFESLYAKSSNVFAAMPSLHSAYPIIVLYYGIKNNLGKLLNTGFALVMLGIWFTAVYSSHHYILDVLAGIVTAVIGITLFNFLTGRKTVVKRFTDTLVRAIE
ncbi:MAG TPA: phosphatase PAP2 family protein [Ferruginibacter sp.]|nr:phosphatase PAP2 family protein [Ferruginibacter sp.]HMP21785.1 phosphatase PAP2 family protein [Ferruginibacter sp.]